MKTQAEDFGRFDFVGKLGLFVGISVAMVLVSAFYLMINGITYGIDFRGGTEMQVRFAETVSIDQLRTAVSTVDVGDIGVQSFGDDHEFLVRFQGRKGETDKATNEMLNADIAKLTDVIEQQMGAAKPDIRRVDTVGPQVGAELKRSSILAVFYSLLVLLIYIAFRFDYQYGPGAIFSLFHDAIITLAIFEATGREVNVPILAAILTLIGFSLNDTIVVFDRIRETQPLYKDRGWAFIINKATNDMLGRTIITSGTTLISSIALAVLSGGTVGDIAFALSLGIFFGTYSSIYVAAPMIILVEKLRGKPA